MLALKSYSFNTADSFFNTLLQLPFQVQFALKPETFSYIFSIYYLLLYITGHRS